MITHIIHINGLFYITRDCTFPTCPCKT